MRFTAVLFTLAIVAGAVLVAVGVHRLIGGWQRGPAQLLVHAGKPLLPGAFLLLGVYRILPDMLTAVLVAPGLATAAVALYHLARWRSRRCWQALDTRRNRAPEIERR
jgi:Na+/H+-dicarboxylate symporter